MKKLGLASMLGSALCFGAFVNAARADDPLMGKSPWNFQQQNRAAIAIAIKNVEDPGSAGGNGGAGTIVCGGNSGASGQGAVGSASGATANSSCIIINNSDGATVTNPQYSDGDQSASSSTSAQTNNITQNNNSIDEVSKILGGNKQGL